MIIANNPFHSEIYADFKASPFKLDNIVDSGWVSERKKSWAEIHNDFQAKSCSIGY